MNIINKIKSFFKAKPKDNPVKQLAGGLNIIEYTPSIFVEEYAYYDQVEDRIVVLVLTTTAGTISHHVDIGESNGPEVHLFDLTGISPYIFLGSI